MCFIYNVRKLVILVILILIDSSFSMTTSQSNVKSSEWYEKRIDALMDDPSTYNFVLKLTLHGNHRDPIPKWLIACQLCFNCADIPPPIPKSVWDDCYETMDDIAFSELMNKMHLPIEPPLTAAYVSQLIVVNKTHLSSLTRNYGRYANESDSTLPDFPPRLDLDVTESAFPVVENQNQETGKVPYGNSFYAPVRKTMFPAYAQESEFFDLLVNIVDESHTFREGNKNGWHVVEVMREGLLKHPTGIQETVFYIIHLHLAEFYGCDCMHQKLPGTTVDEYYSVVDFCRNKLAARWKGFALHARISGCSWQPPKEVLHRRDDQMEVDILNNFKEEL